MAFVTNHLLLLLVQTFRLVLAKVLHLVDQLSFAVNHIVQLTLSQLPYGKPPCQITLPVANFHPGVLVTGTSTGIGHDLALSLAHAGYTVFAGVRRPEDGLDLRDTYERERRTNRRRNLTPNVRPGQILPVILDVANDLQMSDSVAAVQEALEQLDIPLIALVNNAGVSVSSPMELVTDDMLRQTFAVNYIGPVRLTQRLLPLLRRHHGRVINISSVTAWLPSPGFGVYSASKAALLATSNAWRMELAAFGVPVSVIEPGRVNTALWGKLAGQLEYHQSRLASLRPTPGSVSPRPRRRSLSATFPDRPHQSTDTPSGESSPASTSPLAAPTAGKRNNASSAAAATTKADNPLPASPRLQAAGELYEPMFRRLKTNGSDMYPSLIFSSDHCIEAVTHALTSSFPKASYRVGWDSRLASIAIALIGEPVVEFLYRLQGVV